MGNAQFCIKTKVLKKLVEIEIEFLLSISFLLLLLFKNIYFLKLKYTMKKIVLLFVILLFFINKEYAQVQKISEREKHDLKYLYEEERLAHDVYSQLAKKWHSRVFSEIAQSEQQHFTYLLDQLEIHNIPIPKNEVGFYNSVKLNNIYDDFLRIGSVSYDQALQVAAQFEEYDIVDLEEALERTDEKDLQMVYQYLISGAKIHLRKLYRNMKKRKINYEPILLRKIEFEEIVKNKNKKEAKDNRLN